MADSSITGQVVRIVYSNAETGYCVAHLLPDGGQEHAVVVGIMPLLETGDRIKAEGRWETVARFGKQFRCELCHPVPQSIDGVEKYLSSGAIKGIGKRTAKKLVDHFGPELVEILDEDPDRLAAMKGIGQAKAEAIVAAWAQRSGSRRQLIALHALGLGPALANKILNTYQGNVVQMVKANPYRLAKEVRGVGFLTADRIGHHAGIDPSSPDRIEAGLSHFLDEQASEGHCYFPLNRLVPEAAEFLKVDPELVRRIVARLGELGALVVESHADEPYVYLPRIYVAERNVASQLKEIAQAEDNTHPELIRQALTSALEASQVDLTAEQIGALRLCMESRVSVLTGGPGTGKTTVIKALIAGLRSLEADVTLCAPTGRAAKRMTETTGMEAKTIHRLLEFAPQSSEFMRNEHRPLATDALVVDEVSMIDIELMDALVRALPQGARIVMVGDKDQLESVGPGAVLRDLIDSGTVPTATLTQIHRQARRSLIVVNAHQILHGQPLQLRSEYGDEPDFFVMERDDPDAAVETIVELVLNRIPPRFSMNPVKDIQVLTPMYKGCLGASNLNQRLQDALNPGQSRIRKGDKEFRVGDRIMQIKNNYNKDVFNGDVGFIEQIDNNSLIVRMGDGRIIIFENDELDELQLAYAVTVHKAQGSEYPAVLVVLHEQHHIMLRRNLFYTAVTRGKQLVMCIGTSKAINRAIRNDRTRLRYTTLSQRMRQQ